ncbi:PLP-dependent aminotransferase family protein [Azospirillum sp. YIM DDC1]|uniref:PLP-dependent aminotransferase family protein n=1 Tax=Azospirillum aestuarii TaxID=2802052 RepID=A0ABS1HYU6_9PROT|nr:PLP-dependent aminotransferase family protein [Azospirillum aestuarii]MBK4719998.1 PLP-dependent aminotransferase family protein [Azospirillum aestuarii]TWA89829.1 DNA-binding transcriptional MocR family regulator [Azospirillum brasilense]
MTNWVPDLEGRQGPRYRAIADALSDDIANGRLAPGARLPTHRDLAYRLGVTVGTITRAYTEAEKRGLIGGEVGRGTFVQGQRHMPPSDPFTWTPRPEPSVINMTVVTPEHPMSVPMMGATLAAIGASPNLGTLLEYAPHAGLPAHRAAGAQWLTRQHRAAASPDTVLLTTGAQNAMAVAMAAVARPGDVVLTERLTNYGMKTLSAVEGYHLEGIAIDEHGVVPDSFDSACRRLAPKALYLVPTLHNPTASVMPQARRVEIAAIARRYGVVLVEDDVFGFLVHDAKPIQAIAPDVTVYVNSLSKSVSAGLRVGYVVAPPALVPRVEAVIRALQYSSPPLPPEVATRWITDGSADRIAEAQRGEATARQRIARSILPASAVCGHASAQHLWLVLPEPWRRDDFIAEALRRGVKVTGGDVFAVGRASAPHAVRLGLCHPHSRDELARGLRTLADLLENPQTAMLSIV